MAIAEVNTGDFTPITPPEPGSDAFADQLVRRFEPWLTDDLEAYLRTIASMFAQVELLAFDSEDGEGWTILFDPDRCPAESLPYLAQFVGERLPRGLDEASQREWIKDAPNRRRGTAESVFLATQRNLTGSRLVSMFERYQGVVDVVAIRTNTSQTPDPEATRQDILSVLPADVILDFLVVTGVVWDNVAATDSWNTVKTKSWSELASGLSGWGQYQRPR